MEQSVFNALPIWAAGLVFLIVFACAVEVGFRVGLVRRDFWKDADSGGGGVVLTSLFAILGLVLALTYASGVTRYDARKHAVLAEANILHSAYLTADIAAEPGRSELKKALFEYARTRVVQRGTRDLEEILRVVLDKSLRKQARLWPVTRQVIAQDNPYPIETSLVTAMINVFDAHAVRVEAAVDRLPSVVLWMLLLVGAAALFVTGFNAGLQGLISRWRMGALTLVLTGVMVVIMDFDRPQDGMVTVDQSSVERLIADMEADLKFQPR